MFIFRSNGNYLGFIYDNNLFSRDGEYLGWVEGNNVWDKFGNYRGAIYNQNYIVRNLFQLAPVPRVPKIFPATPAKPNPPADRAPIVLPVGLVDGF